MEVWISYFGRCLYTEESKILYGVWYFIRIGMFVFETDWVDGTHVRFSKWSWSDRGTVVETWCTGGHSKQGMKMRKWLSGTWSNFWCSCWTWYGRMGERRWCTLLRRAMKTWSSNWCVGTHRRTWQARFATCSERVIDIRECGSPFWRSTITLLSMLRCDFCFKFRLY